MTSLLIAVVRALLPIINRVHAKVLGIKPSAQSIICVEVRCHKGPPIKLQDGCEVKPGDLVIKLHFNNAWINEKRRSRAELSSRVFPRGFGHYFRDGLQLLAKEVADGKYSSIVALYGWTAFHAHARRFGFQIMDLPGNLRIKLAELHIMALMQSHRIPWFRARTTSRKAVQVKAIWLSRDKLLRIHGSAP
jgi:YkoP domain